MNKVKMIKEYLNSKYSSPEFDMYGGVVETRYGVQFYIGINSLDTEEDDLGYDGKCSVVAFSKNPVLAISAMEMLFGKDDYKLELVDEIEEGEEPEGYEPIYKSFKIDDVSRLYDLTPELVFKMINSEKDVLHTAFEKMRDKEYEDVFRNEYPYSKELTELFWVISLIK